MSGKFDDLTQNKNNMICINSTDCEYQEEQKVMFKIHFHIYNLQKVSDDNQYFNGVWIGFDSKNALTCHCKPPCIHHVKKRVKQCHTELLEYNLV